MADFVPPVILEIIANWASVKAATEGTIASVGEIGAAGETTSAKLSALGSKMGNAFLLGSAGVALAATDLAYKYSEALDQMQQQTNLTEAQMEQVKENALKVSTATATSATKIVEAYTLATKAGFTLAQSQDAVTAAAMFANTQHVDLNTTLQAALNIYKMHIAGTTSVADTMDIFTTAIKNSRLTADGLTTAMSGRALSAFAAYHIDIKTATALLAGFANQGMNGARAQMALSTGFAGLSKPMYTSTGQLSATAKVLQGYGVNAATIASEARQPGGMLTVLGQLNQAWQTNATATERASGEVSFFNQVFGASAGRAFYNMISQLPQLQKLMGQMNASKGATKSAFEVWLSSPAGVLQNFKTAMENALIPLGQFLLPKATQLAKWTTTVFTALAQNKDGLGTLTTVVGGALVAGLAGAKIASLGTSIASMFGSEMVIEAGPIALALATGFLAYLVIKNALKAPTAPNTYGSVQGLSSWNMAAAGFAPGPKGAVHYSGIGSPNYTAGFSEDWVHRIIDTKKDQYGNQMVENAVLSTQQWTAINDYFKKANLKESVGGEATQAYLNAIDNFMAANANGKKSYSVTVNIK